MIVLKKVVAHSLIILLVITAGVGCVDSQAETQYENPEIPEALQDPAPNAPNTYLPQVKIDGVIYYMHGNPKLKIEYLPESFYKGQIQSTVPLTERPTVNDEANFNVEPGMPYAKYGDGYIVLWLDVWTLFVTLSDLEKGVRPTPRIVGGAPENAPGLDVLLKTENSREQRIQTLQLSTSWSVVYEDGNGTGVEADAPHPLQFDLLRDFDKATIRLDALEGTIELYFSDDYPPDSVSVQRWNAVYAQGDQDIMDAIDKSEPVDINVNIFHISDDGSDYIYAVYAIWSNGSSSYTFRVVSGME